MTMIPNSIFFLRITLFLSEDDLTFAFSLFVFIDIDHV
jgi:hypothetical protein